MAPTRLAPLLVLLASCNLTPTQSASIVAAEGVVCEGLAPLASAIPDLPPGVVALAPLVCKGSEALLAAALASASSSAPPAPATVERKPVYRDRARRLPAGFVPPHVAPMAQRAIDDGDAR